MGGTWPKRRADGIEPEGSRDAMGAIPWVMHPVEGAAVTRKARRPPDSAHLQEESVDEVGSAASDGGDH
jgi:hypothetical protein